MGDWRIARIASPGTRTSTDSPGGREERVAQGQAICNQVLADDGGPGVPAGGNDDRRTDGFFSRHVLAFRLPARAWNNLGRYGSDSTGCATLSTAASFCLVAGWFLLLFILRASCLSVRSRLPLLECLAVLLSFSRLCFRKDHKHLLPQRTD